MTSSLTLQSWKVVALAVVLTLPAILGQFINTGPIQYLKEIGVSGKLMAGSIIVISGVFLANSVSSKAAEFFLGG